MDLVLLACDGIAYMAMAALFILWPLRRHARKRRTRNGRRLVGNLPRLLALSTPRERKVVLPGEKNHTGGLLSDTWLKDMYRMREDSPGPRRAKGRL